MSCFRAQKSRPQDFALRKLSPSMFSFTKEQVERNAYDTGH